MARLGYARFAPYSLSLLVLVSRVSGLVKRGPAGDYDHYETGHVRAIESGEQQPPVVHHKRLVKDLLENRGYDPRVRPVKHHSIPINVTIRMNLYQIVDVNERSQHIVLYTWMTQTWVDAFLSWNPRVYGDIDSIVVPFTSVWLPDTYLYNGLEMVRENAERWISVILEVNKTAPPDSPAKVIFRHPALYKFTCNMDILYFPFDKQCCKMTFGSWMYDSSGIDFFALRRDIFQEDFTESEEWTVLSFQSKHKREVYSCCPIPFSHFYAYLLIQRKPLHFLVNLVIPTLIITLISFVGFFSPASTCGERTEKVNLGITTLLAMSILLLMVSDQMPTTSNFVPLIGWFYLSIILLISLATVMTSVIITVQKRGHFGKRVSPRAKRIFFHYVGRMVFMSTPPLIEEFGLIIDKPTQESLVPLTSSASDYGDIKVHLDMGGLGFGDGLNDIKLHAPDNNVFVGFKNQSSDQGMARKKISPGNVSQTRFGSDINLNLPNFNEIASIAGNDANLSSQLKKIQRQLLQLNEYVRAKEHEERIHGEWEWLAAILDRVLLLVFISIVTSVTLVIILVGQRFCTRQLIPDQSIMRQWLLLMCMQLLGALSASALLDAQMDELYMEPITYHSRLVKHLMLPGRYDPRVRPVSDSFSPVNVTVRINLYQVIEVNEYGQFVRIYVWMTQSWTDEFLSWNPKNYNGLDAVVLPFHNIWLPDTYLYNSLQMKQEEVERLTSVIISTNNVSAGRRPTSTVTFRYPAIYSFTCNMDIYYFPFDKQTCTLTFGSWTYDSTGIDYFPVREEVFREDFIESEEWTVMMAKMERRLENYSCCTNSFSLLLVRLTLKRKPLFYIVNLVLPAMVITFVAFVGFFCPDNSTGERKEKVNLGIGTLLAMSVLLLTTSNQMPTTSKYLPLLGLFYLYIILFISLATITTCVIIKVETLGRYGKQMSHGVRHFFFVHVGNLLFMPEPSVLKARPFYLLRMDPTYPEGSSRRPSSRLSFLRAASPSQEQMHLRQPMSWMTRSDTLPNSGSTTPDPTAPISGHFLNVPGVNNQQPSPTMGEHSAGAVSQSNVARLSSRVNNLIESIAMTEQKRETILLEWQWLAMLLDRLFLIFFLSSLVIMTGYLFIVGYTSSG